MEYGINELSEKNKIIYNKVKENIMMEYMIIYRLVKFQTKDAL